MPDDWAILTSREANVPPDSRADFAKSAREKKATAAALSLERTPSLASTATLDRAASSAAPDTSTCNTVGVVCMQIDTSADPVVDVRGTTSSTAANTFALSLSHSSIACSLSQTPVACSIALTTTRDVAACAAAASTSAINTADVVYMEIDTLTDPAIKAACGTIAPTAAVTCAFSQSQTDITSTAAATATILMMDNSMEVKTPGVEADVCVGPVHVALCVSGSMAVRMADGDSCHRRKRKMSVESVVGAPKHARLDGCSHVSSLTSS